MKTARRWIRPFGILALFLLLGGTAYANIVIRALIVNPSQDSERSVPFKSYLPKEIKPENVVDHGDLELAFDPAEGAYYVYKNYTLAPKETVQVEVELQDVWQIPQQEIDLYREEAKSFARSLMKTDYYERATYLQTSIEGKLTQIEYRQRVVSPTPEGYISDYRENIKLLEAVKADLSAAKSLAVEAKGIAPMLTWKLIVAVVVFLGVLGLIFFFVWQRQIKSLAELSEDYGGIHETPEGAPAAEQGEVRAAREEKKSEIEDIEERLRGRPDEDRR
ncbi:MAG: hypothetical protein ACM3L6_02830 [Deltaproteobacteria bacterium]